MKPVKRIGKKKTAGSPGVTAVPFLAGQPNLRIYFFVEDYIVITSCLGKKMQV